MSCFLLSVKYKNLLLSLNDCKQFDPDYHNTGILVFFYGTCANHYYCNLFFFIRGMGGVFTVVIQSDDGYNNDNDENRISGGIA